MVNATTLNAMPAVARRIVVAKLGIDDYYWFAIENKHNMASVTNLPQSISVRRVVFILLAQVYRPGTSVNR